MNFGNIDFQYILFGMASFILAGSIHECAHAFSAYVLGDDTARINGRMTINPLPHIDIWGTIAFPLIGAISGLPVIGWMKPVPVNPLHFRRSSRDYAICSFAGPFSNLLQASFIIIIIKLLQMIIITFGLSSNVILTTVFDFFWIYFLTNICLMIFNLFPVPPLDGGWILRHFLPDDWKDRFDIIYRYGSIILYFLVFTKIFSYIFSPVVNATVSMFAALLHTNIILLILPFAVFSGMILFFLREEVRLFIHRIKHKSTLSILSGEKIDKISANKDLDKNDTIYTNQSEEYKNETKARAAWKTCDGTIFNKQDKTCIKCDKYVKCLSRTLHNTVST
ncbi:MAG: site-2 protease family protein [Spirochaetales bacterium]|nr:site-2 protease family protein [Spirochaetales bacterium]